MKKLVLTLCLILVASVLFAGVKAIVNFKPQFKFDNTPAAEATSENTRGITWNQLVGPQRADWYMTKQDYWLEAFKTPGIMDLGVVAQGDKFGLVYMWDIRQDTLQYFEIGNKGNFSNIPFLKHMIELNFPRLGYIDYRIDNFYASVGRRQIKWGPATYDLALSDSQPYLDNFYAQIDIPMKNGWKFWYGFTGIAYKYFLTYGKYIDDDYTLKGPKSTFAHKFAFENGSFRVAVSELNNVYGKYPTLLDFTPMGLWHDNYQDDFSNVMLNIALEGKVGPVRVFGTFTMDDFDLPHEAPEPGTFSNKPPAIGISAGVEVNLLSGEEVADTRFNYQDYALKDETFKVNTGLNIGYEFYYCSKFMYNRKCEAGKFTAPYQFISFLGKDYCYDENAFYLGFKYGPDSMLHRFYAEYTDNPIKAFFSAELLRRGSYTIDTEYSSTYSNAHLNTPYDLSAPVTTVLMLEAGCSYYLQEGFRLDAALGFTKDFTHDNQAFKASLGASIAICDVDWANLF